MCVTVNMTIVLVCSPAWCMVEVCVACAGANNVCMHLCKIVV